jgi:HAD superfamily hydrolase (TIGR01459 family)
MLHLKCLRDVADRYDGFILDLWGLIHDGATPYPPARATLQALKDAGKKTLLLSNAPRRGYALIKLMTGMGIERELYGEVLSSGEATRNALITKDDPFFAKLGQKVYHLGPERDRNIFDDVSVEVVETVRTADFILNTGPWELTQKVSDFQSTLDEAIVRKLPMVCANPDMVVLRAGAEVVCAGAIAVRYQQMGGDVVYRGKPDPAIYREAAATLGVNDLNKVVVIGDALETDIKGGNAAGIDSIWCTGGIHAAALGCAYGVPADPARAEALAKGAGHIPNATIPGFMW